MQLPTPGTCHSDGARGQREGQRKLDGRETAAPPHGPARGQEAATRGRWANRSFWKSFDTVDV